LETKQKIPPLYKELISSFPKLLETKQEVPPLYKELILSFPRLLETKQEVPPLYKGRLGGVCAFTLVELIVVITILAIL
jgi:prepilin-type N-terminal cleavage/methylation domain-containing protein